MLSEFDKLVKQRAELKAWWSLGTTIAEYDSKYHSLRVDVAKPTMVTFCGQAYAGAKSYHDAPAGVADIVRREIEKSIKTITADAVAAEIARLDAAIEKHREAVLKELSAV